jgi:5-methylcytosine-specific restriction endonuclease McrA
MLKIYSKINPEKLLHIIFNLNEVNDRVDLIPEDNFLQVSVVRKTKGKKFKTHKHIYKQINHTNQIAQESWLVYKGKIMVYHYDIDDSLLGTHELSEGDMNITLFGGHTFEILEDDTIICEQKNGPYYGQELDKKFINVEN